jgi:undecaprenyl-diphosphatase
MLLELVQAALLGLLQGLTEFLPISSSGHLVLVQQTLPGWTAPGVLFDALLHVGTLGSVLTFYRHDVARLLGGVMRRERAQLDFALALIVGSVPTALIGLGFEDWFDQLFVGTVAVGFFLLVTAALLVAARVFWPGADRTRVGWVDALWIGTLQGLAIAPGVSRSGATVAAGLFRRIEPELVARYSFLLSVPAILGATMLKALGGSAAALPAWPVVAIGMAAAFLSGLLAIRVFVGTLVRGNFLWFAGYCTILAVVTLVFL